MEIDCGFPMNQELPISPQKKGTLADSKSGSNAFAKSNVTDNNGSDIELRRKENEDVYFFLETSDVIMRYYKHQQAYSLEKYFMQIDNWLQKKHKNNLPLVIESHTGVGKKTLLVNWMEYHNSSSSKNFKDVIITHFASGGGNMSNYFFAIYRILVKQRELFNIKQKVELLEEKIRKNFLYWLDLCSRKIMKNITFDGEIIILIEGIEHFKEQDTHMESNLKFWLPKIFPDKVRFIITADHNSASYAYLQELGCECIHIHSTKDELVLDGVLNVMKTKDYFCPRAHAEKIFEITKNDLNDECRANVMFIKTMIAVLCPYETPVIIKESEIKIEFFTKLFKDFDYNCLKNIRDTDHLMEWLQEFYSDKIFKTTAQYEKLICCLTQTFKGLSEAELDRIVGFEPYEWENFIAIFKSILFLYQGLWKISNENFTATVERMYIQKKQGNFKKQMHMEVYKAQIKTPPSIRKLEELTNHLYTANEYFLLKQCISDIENFVLLFNSFTKYDLCRYWQALECHDFDPVEQFNKGLELFDMHYSPKADELFTIILQISRFLKEFTDFETKKTPEFRHAVIKGKVIQQKDGESKKKIGDEKGDKTNLMDHFCKLDCNEIEGAPTSNCLQPFLYDVEVSEEDTDEKHPFGENKINYLEDIGLYAELKKLQMTTSSNNTNQNPVISGHEVYNVDVPSGKAHFLQYFYDIYHNKRQKKNLLKEETDYNYGFDLEDEKIDDNSKNGNYQLLEQNEKKKDSTDRAFKQLMIEDIDLAIEPERQPTFYYYKRWIWMIFPWICLSVNKNSNYSDLISKCYSSNIGYLSVEEEMELTRHAINIVMVLKIKKLSMMANKKPDDSDKTEIDQSLLLSNNRKSKEQSKLDGHCQTGNLKKSTFFNTNGASTKMSTLPTERQFLSNKNGKNKSLGQIQSMKLAGTMPQLELQNGTPKNKSTMPQLELQNGTPKNNVSVISFEQNIGNLRSGASSFRLKSNGNIFIKRDNNIKTMVTGKKQLEPISTPRVMSTLQDFTQHSKVSQVLNKSQYWEDRLVSLSYKPEIVSILKNQKTNQSASLSLLNDAQNSYTKKEIDLLERKNNQLILEYNKLVKKVGVRRKELENKTQFLINMPKECPYEAHLEEQEIENLDNDGTDYDKKCLVASEQKQRTIRIIEICEINQIQDTEWIRNLQFYLTNLRKVIRSMAKDINVCEKEVADQTTNCEMFIKQYNIGVKNYMRLCDNIEQSIAAQKQIDASILGTNDMIYESVLKKQANNERLEQINQDNIEKEKQKKVQEKKKKKVADELHQLENDYEKIKEVFENETDNAWDEKPKFKKLLESFDKKKDLNRYSQSVDSRLNDNRKELERIKKIQDTHNKAQEFAPVDNTIKDTVILQNEILRLNGEKIKLRDVIQDKHKAHCNMEKERSKWSLFHSSIIHRLTGSLLNENMSDEDMFNLIREKVAKIQAFECQELCHLFLNGDDKLEKDLIERLNFTTKWWEKKLEFHAEYTDEIVSNIEDQE